MAESGRSKTSTPCHDVQMHQPFRNAGQCLPGDRELEEWRGHVGEETERALRLNMEGCCGKGNGWESLLFQR